MNADVLVIGSGVAATGAALAAAARGKKTTLVRGGSGATVLGTGAIDHDPWELGRPIAPLDEAVKKALDALDLFDTPDRGALLATTAGVLRPARGHDRALLDLAKLPEGAVLVPRCDRQGWDATALARSFGEASKAKTRGLTFAAIDVQILRMREERSMPDGEIAKRHDDPERLSWLGERLKDFVARGTFVGVLLPPWLGVTRPLAAELSRVVGLPCGEAIVGLAGAPGQRFERARERALGAAGVHGVHGWGASVDAREGELVLTLESGEEIDARAVVLALGGLVGGGLVYQPSAAMAGAVDLPSRSRVTFRTGLVTPGTIGARGKPLDTPGTLFGGAPETLSAPFTDDPIFDRAGLLVSETGAIHAAPRGLFAGGDLVADQPRTFLAALASGVRAGEAAAEHA